MKKLEIKTRKLNEDWEYSVNNSAATVFLSHSEDRITVIGGIESVNIEIYDNDRPLFIGTKQELFQLLRDKKE